MAKENDKTVVWAEDAELIQLAFLEGYAVAHQAGLEVKAVGCPTCDESGSIRGIECPDCHGYAYLRYRATDPARTW